MKCALSSKTNLLRAELIHLIERGDSSARELLSGLAEYHDDSVEPLVCQYRKTAGSVFLERFLFCLGALCLGLSLGVCGLTVADLVPAEVESLLLCFSAFLLAQWSLSLYGKRAHARFYANGYSRVLARLSTN